MGLGHAVVKTCSDHLSSSMIEPDILLPSQFLDLRRGQIKDGERRLMVAVLSDGIEAYINYCTSDTPGKFPADICEWVHRRNLSYVFSFDVVCESLGIDPEYLRIGLAKYLAAFNKAQREELPQKAAWKRIRRPRKRGQ